MAKIIAALVKATQVVCCGAPGHDVPNTDKWIPGLTCKRCGCEITEVEFLRSHR